MALLSGTIPEEWCKRWETGPIKPQSWLKELIRKRLALMRWRSASVKGALLNESLNLGELFNPATFISALRQMSARSIGCAIDKMKMVSGLDRELEKTNCSHICRINGLLLEGASIDSFGHLQESSPDANELVPVSTLSIGYVSIDSPTMSLKDAYIKIPVFVSTNRVEYLLDVDLKLETTDSGNSKYESNNDTQPTKTKWILAGVALFLKQEE
jgi:dynein heavy chain 2